MGSPPATSSASSATFEDVYREVAMHPSDPDGSAIVATGRAMPETALYPTVKGFLEAAGFAVKGEVCG
jgi:hypothetical protein